MQLLLSQEVVEALVVVHQEMASQHPLVTLVPVVLPVPLPSILLVDLVLILAFRPILDGCVTTTILEARPPPVSPTDAAAKAPGAVPPAASVSAITATQPLVWVALGVAPTGERSEGRSERVAQAICVKVATLH